MRREEEIISERGFWWRGKRRLLVREDSGGEGEEIIGEREDSAEEGR